MVEFGFDSICQSKIIKYWIAKDNNSKDFDKALAPTIM